MAGAFILGALMTPDMTRFNRRPSDVVKQTLLGVTLGEYLIGLTAVMLGHAARTADIVGIITTSSGLLGTLILATSILKINDWNLYSSALATVNSVDVLFGRRVGRRGVTLVIGTVGTVLSAAGIADDFTGFLETIGVLAPPVAGIIIAEYYVVRRYRADLERARRTGREPDIPNWLPCRWSAGPPGRWPACTWTPGSPPSTPSWPPSPSTRWPAGRWRPGAAPPPQRPLPAERQDEDRRPTCYP